MTDEKTWTLRERTEMSRAFSSGNYANAYETTDLETALARSRYTAAHTCAAFVLGFFASYELDEMSGDEREAFDDAYWSDAGRYVVNVARYCDSRDDDYKTECGDPDTGDRAECGDPDTNDATSE